MKRWLLSIAVVIGVIWFLGFIYFVRYINSYDIDTNTKTDAIIVLTGGRNRISEGIKLLNADLADRLFISGVPEEISIKQIESQDKIELGRKAKNTIENAIETEEWIRKNNIKSIRLVTSSYHIPRSMQEFIIYVTMGNDLEVILNPIYSPNVNPKWWVSWGTFKLLLLEYNKFLIVYVCRHLHIY